MTPAELSKILYRMFGKGIYIEEQPNGCWYCPTKKAHTNGYYVVKRQYLHRIVLTLVTSSDIVKAGPKALHSCDYPGCINPAHLRWGTDRDNSRDMVERGRSAAHLNENLTFEQIYNIRATSKREMKTIELARMYGVSSEVIRRIRNGETYKQIPLSEISDPNEFQH